MKTKSEKIFLAILPSIKELASELKGLKPYIEDDFIQEGDEKPSITITFAADKKGWAIQTGDNSYSGSAYGYSNWAVGYLYRNSNCRNLAKDLLEEVKDLFYQSQA